MGLFMQLIGYNIIPFDKEFIIVHFFVAQIWYTGLWH